MTIDNLLNITTSRSGFLTNCDLSDSTRSEIVSGHTAFQSSSNIVQVGLKHKLLTYRNLYQMYIQENRIFLNICIKVIFKMCWLSCNFYNSKIPKPN